MNQSGNNWWQQAKGTQSHSSIELQEIFDKAGDKKLIIVDLYMPECYYCMKFKDAWNKIVDEFTAEYGSEQI